MGQKEMLESIRNNFWKGPQEKEVQIGEITFTIKLLTHAEEVWRDKFVAASASYAFISSRKSPTLAIAITAINGEPVAALFPPEAEKDATDPQSVERIEMLREIMRASGLSADGARYQVAIKIMDYLGSLPDPVIMYLYDQYEELAHGLQTTLTEMLKKK